MLFRSHPEELEAIGLRDLLTPQSVCLIEWPERAADRLPEPEWRVQIDYADTGRRVDISARDGQRLNVHL